MAILDLAGKKFNRLTVKSFAYCKGGNSYWNCVCECGKYYIAKGSSLKRGNTKSCGCYKSYTSMLNATKMGKANQKNNEIIIENGYAKIKMSNCDEFALIDIEDIPKIKDYCWNYQKRSYYPSAKINGKRKYLHRIIMPNDDKRFVTDHINRNPLDNRKSNLRIVTQCVNCQNEDKRTTNTTGYKNISYISTRDIYVVAFRANHKNHYVGSYRYLETAVQKLEEYKKEHNL